MQFSFYSITEERHQMHLNLFTMGCKSIFQPHEWIFSGRAAQNPRWMLQHHPLTAVQQPDIQTVASVERILST